MFDRTVRRHPVQTFEFWFVVLTCFFAVTAWKLDLLPLPRAPLPVVSDEPMPPPPENAELTAELVDTAPQQSEIQDTSVPPELASVTVEDKEAAINSELPEQHEATLAMEPIARNPVRTASLDRPDLESHILQASASIPAMPAVLVEPLQRSPQTSEIISEADRLIASGDDVAALRLLSTSYWKEPQRRADLMERLNMLAGKIYFLPAAHYVAPHQIQFGDRLETIASKYRLTREYLAKLNRMDAAPLRAGQTLKVIQGPFAAVADVSEMQLTIHAQGYYLCQFPIGFGIDAPIPEGKFRVTDKVLNPDYYGAEGVVSHTDPTNPLGTRWLTLNDENRSLQAYGVHGTVDPALIGKTDGIGCLRMRSRDVETVFDLLTVGAEFAIQP